MKTMLHRLLSTTLLGLSMTLSASALTRTVTITTPTSPVYAGQSVSIPTSVFTDGPGGEQIGFYHLEYSTNGGSNWNAVAYDVNVGTSASRTVNLTAGAAGSVIAVRLRVAFRYGSAGDVDYNGNAIDWSGSWDLWQTPPTKYAYVSVATTRSVTISAPASTYAGQTLSIPTSVSTDGPGGEQIGFYHLEYSTNGGVSWNAVAYDVNVGTAASRTATITAGATGSTIVVRLRVAFRYGTAGDVDYNGTAIDWSGSWSLWQTPPTKYAYVSVVPAEQSIMTASSTGTYHLKGSIVKNGNPSDPNDFGDGVIVEVFKRSGTTDTVLWTSMLARPNSANPAKVNLTVALAQGDLLGYRLNSHTSNTSWDSISFPSAFTAAAANILTLNGITPSTSTSDNKTDDIQTLINYAASLMNADNPAYDRVEIVLPAGTYYLQDSGAGSSESLLAIGSTKNITLRGPGASLVINAITPKMFLSVGDSSNIEIDDLVLDYETSCLPFIQGTVSSINGTSAVLALSWAPQGTSRFSDSLFCLRFDQTDPTLLNSSAIFDISSCSISGSTATITVNSGSLALNDPVVLAIRGNTSRLQEAALRFSSTTDCSINDVTLRAGGWIAMIGRANNGLHLNGYRVQQASGSNRLISTNGDAMQLKDSLRGPTVRNCTFRGMADDGINLHATIVTTSKTGTNCFTANSTVQVGDVLQVYQWDSGNNGQALNYQTHYRVTAVSSGTITVDATIPDNINRYVNVSASGEGFLIRNNTFFRNRNRGCLIQTGYGLIDQNSFQETSGLALSFESNLGQTNSVEGPYPHHTVTRNNTFNRTNYGVLPASNPAIQIWGHNLVSPPAPMFQALAANILNNTFQSQSTTPVSVLTGSEQFDATANTIQ